MSAPESGRRSGAGVARRGKVEDIEMRKLREDLDRNYKKVFDKHGPEGVPLQDLRQELEEEGITDHMTQERLNSLLNNADANRDAQITYGEFVKLMEGGGQGGVTREERQRFRGIISAAIDNIIPQSMKEDFIANYNCRPPPLFIPIISAIEIAVFIYYAVELEAQGRPITATTGVDMSSPLVYRPSRRYEAWRFLTYMFMHQGYIHILSNMIFQLLFGVPLEFVHKFWRVMIVYILGVIAGSLAHSCTDHYVGLVGASGGVYALLGAHVAAIITNWREMNYECCSGSIKRILLSAPVRLTVILVLVLPDTGIAIYRRISAPDEFKVGVTAHIGGFLAGLLLGVPVLKNVQKLPWETTLGWVTLALYLAFVAFAIMFNGFYKGYPATDWS
ncbi:rhomboid-related protein 2 isoform X1 [Patella vulgata]|uniref:rhomboid-related protein 2 isoform X1 n=1 Tax=Patella vulgata TaxID=6465 RepID=UPI00217F6B11|nr:rhomboid-related protein 2 isoform X1 [Patella vulgata]